MRNLDDIARGHHGLVTREDARLSASAWHRAIRTGRLVRMHPGVARLPGTPDTPEQRIAAAVLACGPSALASHRSAAHLWGIPRQPHDPVDVIVPGRTQERHLDGVVVHRPRDGRRLTPQRREGIACTNVLRTLVDLGAVDPASVRGALGHVLTVKLASIDAVATALEEHARPGRAGVTALREAVDFWSIDSRPADSVLETAMRRLVVRYRLPPVEFHPLIDGWEVDFRVIGTPVILECDGWTSHGLQREQFERDRLRDGRLAAAGWVVVRFTYRAIVTTPAQTARRIAAAVERWRHVPSPDAA